MNQHIAEMLATGGKTNSLGKVNDVINLVLKDKTRLEELYLCMFDDDAWVRMRAADALEKICREHPEWLLPYINKLINELSSSTQPSIQWHLAQIYSQVELTEEQRITVTNWLEQLLTNKDADWIVAANSMDTLFKFTKNGYFPVNKTARLLRVQQKHKSNAVKKRANKYISGLTAK